MIERGPYEDEGSESGLSTIGRVLMWAALGVVVCLLLAGLAWGGWRLYQAREKAGTDSLLTQAADAFRARRTGLAVSILRQVLLRERDNVRATQMMAELAGGNRAPEALYWWRRVHELAPDNLLASIQSATLLLNQGDPDECDRIIDAARERHGPRADLAVVKAASAARRGRLDQARDLFLEAARLAPDNRSHKLNALALDLVAIDPARSAAARAELDTIAGGAAPEAFMAAQFLLQDALRRRQRDEALRRARTLAARTDAGFDRHMTCLSAFRTLDAPDEMRALLDALRRGATRNPARQLTLHGWANAAGFAGDAIAWAKTLDPETMRRVPHCILVAESYILERRWTDLETWVHRADWQGFGFMVPFLLDRAGRESGRPDESLRRETIEQARAARGGLDTLAAFARAWGWIEEEKLLLWASVEQPDAKPIPQLKRLHAICLARRDTAGLYRVLVRAYELAPLDPMVQNNLASIEFLLYGRRGLPVKLADELYARDPQHPAYAATYAFGLHLAGRSQDALVIVARIAPQHLARPELRLYHALFLAACGRIDEARERARGLEERMFLPEEWALLRATLPGTEEAPETPAPAPPPTRAPAPGT